MEQISNSNLINDVDIAVAAWHEDGRWTLALLPDAHDLAQIIDRLKSNRQMAAQLHSLQLMKSSLC